MRVRLKVAAGGFAAGDVVEARRVGRQWWIAAGGGPVPVLDDEAEPEVVVEGAGVVVEGAGVEPAAVKLPTTEPAPEVVERFELDRLPGVARVSVSVGRTVNTGDFSNVRADVSFACDCPVADRDRVVVEARAWVLAELARTVGDAVPVEHPEATAERRVVELRERERRNAALLRAALGAWFVWEGKVRAFREAHPQAHEDDEPLPPRRPPHGFELDDETRERWLAAWRRAHALGRFERADGQFEDDPDADIPF